MDDDNRCLAFEKAGDQCHEQRLQKVGEPFDLLARVPGQAVPMREIPGITHGNHGVIEKAEPSRTVEGDERGPEDQGKGICGVGNAEKRKDDAF